MSAIKVSIAGTNGPGAERIENREGTVTQGVLGARVLNRHRVRLLLTAGLLVTVLGCYGFPYFAWIASKPALALPPVFGPDLTLYLNLAGMHRIDGQGFINPYYHCVVPNAEFGYLSFRAAFLLFDVLRSFSGLSLGVFTIAWNALWWLAICGAGLWFYRESLPKADTFVGVLGLVILMFWNFGTMSSLVSAWTHLPRTAKFEALQLPYMRAFFPAIPVALVLVYLALQVRALRSKDWANWCGMAFVQLAALVSFPYATVIMAATTLVASSAQLVYDHHRWREIVVYGAGCACVDILWIIATSTLAGNQSAHPAFLLPNFSLVRPLFGGAAILLCSATALVAAIPPSGLREAKWVLVGLGAANVALLFGDALFSPAFFQLSQHGGYFLHMTLSLQCAYLIARLMERHHRYAPAASGVLVGLLLSNAILLTSATYRHFLPFNKELATFARVLTSIHPSSADLVITESRGVDDLCAWVPLATPAQTLFCRDAAIALTQRQRREEYRFRQAIYLYLTGSDTQSVERTLEQKDTMGEQMFLAFPGEIDPSDSQSTARGIEAVRNDLIPLLGRVADQDSSVKLFLRQFARVIVIDQLDFPTFLRARLQQFLVLQRESSCDRCIVLEYTAR